MDEDLSAELLDRASRDPAARMSLRPGHGMLGWETVVAQPRTFKTAFLAAVILRYPGPVVATTTKADVYGLTAAVRGWRGPVQVFNPQLIGGVANANRFTQSITASGSAGPDSDQPARLRPKA